MAEEYDHQEALIELLDEMVQALDRLSSTQPARIGRRVPDVDAAVRLADEVTRHVSSVVDALPSGSALDARVVIEVSTGNGFGVSLALERGPVPEAN